MGPQVYYLIEAYAKRLCDTERFTGELTALCCRAPGSALKGLSEDEAVLLEALCASAQRFSGEADEPFPSRDMLNEEQFRAFFDRLYPELHRRMPYEVQRAFFDGGFDRKKG